MKKNLTKLFLVSALLSSTSTFAGSTPTFTIAVGNCVPVNGFYVLHYVDADGYHSYPQKREFSSDVECKDFRKILLDICETPACKKAK